MKSGALQKRGMLFKFFYRLRLIKVDNKGLRGLSVLLAIVLFVVSRQPLSEVRINNVQVDFTGLSQGVEISNNTNQTVGLRLRGPRDIVRGLTSSQLSVMANLTNKEPGERMVQLRPEDVTRPDNIQVVQIDPPSIKLLLEPTTSKWVKVEPQYFGQVAEGMEVYGVVIKPHEIEIEGPQSQINKVNSVLTETVNMTRRKSDFRIAVDVETPYNSIRVKNPTPISLSFEIGERRSTRRITKVPIEVIDQTPGVRLAMKTVDVEVYGPQSAVESLQIGDLRVEVTTNELTADPGVVKPVARLMTHKDKRIEVKRIFPSEVRIKR